jgi:hypothetical protein
MILNSMRNEIPHSDSPTKCGISSKIIFIFKEAEEKHHPGFWDQSAERSSHQPAVTHPKNTLRRILKHVYYGSIMHDFCHQLIRFIIKVKSATMLNIALSIRGQGAFHVNAADFYQL